MKHSIVVREMQRQDCPVFARRRGRDEAHFATYLAEQTAGKRTVLVGELDGKIAGYITILWEAGHPPYREEGIPEIVDFIVFDRRKGVGHALLEEAENRMSDVSNEAGVGVGMSPEYGAAQVLYAKHGFIPDGRGLSWNGNYVKLGDQVTVDHGLILYLTKRFGSESRHPTTASNAIS
jgi:GNAT superfamily N-acetyltransferase